MSVIALPRYAETSELQDADQVLLGERLRERRRSVGLTLREVADGAGLSVGFISQIERGITTPSLTSLVKVSRILGRPMSAFLSLPPGHASTHPGQRPHYVVGTGSLVYERISTSFDGSQLTTVIIHQPAGCRSEPVAHEGEEIFYMLSGAITVEVEGERHVLQPGDSLHFSSNKVHSTWNHTNRSATMLHTCTMNVFGESEAVQRVVAPAGRRPASAALRRRKVAIP